MTSRKVLGIVLALLLLVGVGVWIRYAMKAFPLSQDVQHPEMNSVYGAVRVWKGDALFPKVDRSPYWISLYTPLNFLVVGGISKVVAQDEVGVLKVARAVSIASTLFCVLAIGMIARRCGAGRYASLAAAGMFFSSALLIPWGFMGRVDLMALALTLGAIWAAVAKKLAWAVPLCIAAIFTKQSLLCAPLLIAWIAWREGNRKAAGYFLGSVVGFCVVLVAVFQWQTHGTFLDHTVFRVSLPLRAANVPEILHRSWITLLPALFLAFFSGSIRKGPRSLIAGWGILAGTLGLLAMLRVGSDRNYLLETVAALSILASGTFARWKEVHITVLLIGIAFLAWDTDRRIRGPVRYLVGTPENEEAVATARQGRTLVANPNVAVRSHQEAFVSDPFLHGGLHLRGKSALERLRLELKEKRFDRLVLDYCSREKKMPSYQGVPFWSPEFVEIVESRYREVREVDGYCVYIRRNPQAE